MARMTWLLLFVVFGPAAVVAEKPESRSAELRQQTRKLGHRNYNRRMAASRSLRAAGEAAVPHLHNALLSRSLEIRMRAMHVLQAITADRLLSTGWKREFERSLETTRLTVRFDQLALEDALAHLSDRTGRSYLLDMRSKLARKPVSLSVKGQTVRAVLDSLTRQAGAAWKLSCEAVVIASTTRLKRYPLDVPIKSELAGDLRHVLPVRITLDFTETPVRDIFSFIGQVTLLYIDTAPLGHVDGLVTIQLRNIAPWRAYYLALLQVNRRLELRRGSWEILPRK